ncbi:HET-domain-containing protein, partial [Stipitochalara longipes BDJ]
MPQYVYTPLPNDQRTIRLLLLHPRSPKGLVRCSLIRTTIDTAPRFVAVSYTWGSSEKPVTILVDGKAFKITANAFSLLRDISSFLFPRIIWIDSICIDQSSIPEKTHQVQLMSAIYQRAFQVTIWLNHPSMAGTDSPLAHYQAAIDAALAYDLIHKLSVLHGLSLPPAAYLNLSMGMSGISRRMQPLTRLIQNPWFERIWVVQEGLISVVDALQTTGLFKATDLRDHIFGLTGLCGRDKDGWMTPDYALKFNDVFFRAALRLVEEEGLLRTISFAGTGFHTHTTPGLEDLPSWIADWSQESLPPLSDPETKVP